MDVFSERLLSRSEHSRRRWVDGLFSLRDSLYLFIYLRPGLFIRREKKLKEAIQRRGRHKNAAAWEIIVCLEGVMKGPSSSGDVTQFDFMCDLTITGVCVTQSLFGVQSYADVPPSGGRRAVAGACALVVTAATTH